MFWTINEANKLHQRRLGDVTLLTEAITAVANKELNLAARSLFIINIIFIVFVIFASRAVPIAWLLTSLVTISLFSVAIGFYIRRRLRAWQTRLLAGFVQREITEFDRYEKDIRRLPGGAQ